MCLGMSGVDREADASALKACLQEWLPQEARPYMLSTLLIPALLSPEDSSDAMIPYDTLRHSFLCLLLSMIWV